ncbi:MAG: DUF4595 domain-containing protein, partial [Muribaculaceae bacterium]|nr:DUF4595 domain-containing protein [Muribaculaceae bacterium]
PYGDKYDTWFYSYNSDWTPKRIYRTTDGTENGPLDREWIFAYDGNTITVTGKNEYTMTRNEQGYVTRLVEGSTTYDYAYDEEGHMIQASKNGEVVSNITIENGDITKWSRFSNGAEQWKLHTYMPVENVGGCHAITAESIGASRWLIETHLFGVASKHLHATNVWEGAEKSSTFTFDTDDKGRVTAEHKLYGESLEEYFYTYMD